MMAWRGWLINWPCQLFRVVVRMSAQARG